MRTIPFLTILTLIALYGCGGQGNRPQADQLTALSRQEIKQMSFDELFRAAEPGEIPADVFSLVGGDYTVITAGDIENHNSMVASWGGWGILFNKPTTWNFLRANRYTLEFIRERQTYTMAYFDGEFSGDIMQFGTRSGRDTDKMAETALTVVETPSGNIAWKEAKLVIECSLTAVTTVSPDDFYTPEGGDFVTEGYEDTGDYHKLVFGEITGVWISK